MTFRKGSIKRWGNVVDGGRCNFEASERGERRRRYDFYDAPFTTDKM